MMGKRMRRKIQYLQYGFSGSQRKQQASNGGGAEGFSAENKIGSPTKMHKKRVVIVDDDTLVRSIFARILSTHGFEIVASLSDGEAIIKSLDQMTMMPDIIVLDERMPKMSGVEASKIIRSKYPNISIVFVSADESAKERAKSAGANAFLFKPVNSKDLVFTLNSL